jgi:hypothetical protein
MSSGIQISIDPCSLYNMTNMGDQQISQVIVFHWKFKALWGKHAQCDSWVLLASLIEYQP